MSQPPERWGGLIAELDRRLGRFPEYTIVHVVVPVPKGPSAVLLEPVPACCYPNTQAANDAQIWSPR